MRADVDRERLTLREALAAIATGVGAFAGVGAFVDVLKDPSRS